MSEEKLVFIGIVASSTPANFLSISAGFLAVAHGKIIKTGSQEEFSELQRSGLFTDYKIIHLGPHQFLMPGLVDCHTHAPQFPNIGLGLDRPLLQWLDKYTFPLERQYDDMEFAAKVYHQVVERLLINGTTTACYFGSLHLAGTLQLVKTVIEQKQRALVGKVSMNIQNVAGYYNKTEKELAEVKIFVETVLAYKNDLVLPVVTPRFAVSCDTTLMAGLAEISERYNCRIQSHISETLKEVEHVLIMNPGCSSYSDVYDKSHILNQRCIMAHAVHLTDEDIGLLSTRDVSVAHCPASNTRLRSGLCPVRKLLNNNIRVGLGTDVAGGDSASILDAMRRTMDVSTHLALQGGKAVPIDWKEAFYLATLGGAKALKLDHKIGSFEVSKEFDALLIDVYPQDGPIVKYDYNGDPTEDTVATSLVQRFVYMGDDRNIVQVYVNGEKVKDIMQTSKGKKSHK